MYRDTSSCLPPAVPDVVNFLLPTLSLLTGFFLMVTETAYCVTNRCPRKSP